MGPPAARSCHTHRGARLALGHDARPRAEERAGGGAGAGWKPNPAPGRAAPALPKPREPPAREGTRVTRGLGHGDRARRLLQGRGGGTHGVTAHRGHKVATSLPPRCCHRPQPAGRVNGCGQRRYTSAVREQKVCQWDRRTPAAWARGMDAGPIATVWLSPMAGWWHLHKGQPVAAGLELGKKYLQWEESKYRGWDILIASWEIFFLTLFCFLAPF